jgi:hypothetical protein
MPAPVELSIDRSARFGAHDRVQLEVSGQCDPASLRVWPPETRSRTGFGHARFGEGLFGAGKSNGFGRGAFGRGCLCRPASVVTLAWQSLHDAGDLDIRLRAVDLAGNLGDWSEPRILAHRPSPAIPADAAVANSIINITRSNSNA